MTEYILRVFHKVARECTEGTIGRVYNYNHSFYWEI